MRFQIIACLSLLAVSACGHNAARLARNADPKVCAASETTDTLFEIMKEHSEVGTGTLAGTGLSVKEFYDSMGMKATDVTSTGVDKDAKSVSCNATINVTSKNSSKTLTQSVDYQVKPDLSNDSNVVVSASFGSDQSAIFGLAISILEQRKANQNPPIQTTSASSPDTANQHPASGTGYGSCSITVDGTKYLDLRSDCYIETSEGLTTIGTGPNKPYTYFAYISPDDAGHADIAWNSKDKYDKAEDDLGDDFRAEGSCWVNARASICASL